MPETKSEAVTITKEDLQALITSAITAARAPNVIEQRELDKQEKLHLQELENRKKTAEQIKDKMEQDKWSRMTCSHQHSDAARGTHLVYVMESRGPGYLLCQACIAKIRPGAAPQGYKGGDIYDTAKFNALFQTIPSNSEIMG